MTEMIAGVYEIDKEIGSGGGGIVYIGHHTRLEKTVVLKADKRTLSTGRDVLRREVDLLKELSHMYIPQVYDFVQEGDTVYTVMDYIEGESLDKLLSRGERPAQPQVVKWGCQILEALCYLHSRPPYGILHGDIKPANIMLRPNGDICLIDFNIALALGEEGAIKVGFSRGYASPEHYGAEYIRGDMIPDEHDRLYRRRTYADSTEVLGGTESTEVLNETAPHTGSSTAARKAVYVDARSDIYSLGATLYHLISGARPAYEAREVKPLDGSICSKALADIINKAMQPLPENRYQTAEEMLEDFCSLYSNDIRTVRHRHRLAAASVLSAALFLTGGIFAFAGINQMKDRQEALKLAEYSADALDRGDTAEALRLAMDAVPADKGIFSAPCTANAQKALTDALGVYDLSDSYKADGLIELESAPFHIALSPQGRYAAVGCAYEVDIYDMSDVRLIKQLPALKSALADVLFIEEDSIAYAGENGVTVYDISKDSIRWTGDTATTISLSGDGSRLAAVDRGADEYTVYGVSDGTVILKGSFGGKHLSVAENDIFADPEDNLFELNEDGSYLAASFSDGSVSLYDLGGAGRDMDVLGSSDYYHFEGGFYGKYFGYAASDGIQSEFRLIETDTGEYAGEYRSRETLHLRPNNEGFLLSDGNLLVRLDPRTLEEKELAYTANRGIVGFDTEAGYVLLLTDDRKVLVYDAGANLMTEIPVGVQERFVCVSGGTALIGNSDEDAVRILRLKSQEEANLMSYDPKYKHTEARVSNDDRHMMLFNYRGFRIYDTEGRQVADIGMPDAEKIIDQQYRRDEKGSYLEVYWYDGTVREYSGDTGELMSERKEQEPSRELEDEFYTDKYRIVSKMHSKPEVYDVVSGKRVATLDEDAYITYVTQTDEGVIIQYVTADGEHYGLLMNDDFEALAKLPDLCDIKGDRLIFDYKSGNLRQCCLYSLQELKDIGEDKIKDEGQGGEM